MTHYDCYSCFEMYKCCAIWDLFSNPFYLKRFFFFWPPASAGGRRLRIMHIYTLHVDFILNNRRFHCASYSFVTELIVLVVCPSLHCFPSI